MTGFSVRPARTGDVRGIQALLEPWVQRRVLLGKDLVVLFESVQQFTVAEDADGNLIGCGALHVMWDDLGEIRTLIVADEWLHHGVGRAIVDRLEENARALGLRRLFCLTFEVEFFSARGGRRRIPGSRACEAEHARQHPDAENLRVGRIDPCAHRACVGLCRHGTFLAA